MLERTITKDYLIRLFTMDGKPFALKYRRLGHARKDWKAALPILQEMQREGSVKIVDSNRTSITYLFIDQTQTL